ncbi:hypothetical protein [Comamonas sp. lk]|uniref:hypothetical protein n=1 Tax=Comamonas sp. lk TaxID=2201272 RepID=UPI000EB02023|nr:hypothetical protein [Comamonas sp. lk]
MKKPFRPMNGVRLVLLGTAALALYLPAMNLQQDKAAAAQGAAQVKLPAGISLASAQTSWHAVFASRY